MSSRLVQTDSRSKSPTPTLRDVAEPAPVAKAYVKTMSQGYRRRMKKKGLLNAEALVTPSVDKPSNDKLTIDVVNSESEETSVSKDTVNPETSSLVANAATQILPLAREEIAVLAEAVLSHRPILPTIAPILASQPEKTTASVSEQTAADLAPFDPLSNALLLLARPQILIGPNGVPILLRPPQMMAPKPLYHPLCQVRPFSPFSTSLYANCQWTHILHAKIEDGSTNTRETSAQTTNTSTPTVITGLFTPIFQHQINTAASTERFTANKTIPFPDGSTKPQILPTLKRPFRIPSPLTQLLLATVAHNASVKKHAAATASMPKARYITNLRTIKYPPGFPRAAHTTKTSSGGRDFNYDVPFLLSFRDYCLYRPKVNFENIIVRRWEFKADMVNPFLVALIRLKNKDFVYWP